MNRLSRGHGAGCNHHKHNLAKSPSLSLCWGHQDQQALAADAKLWQLMAMQVREGMEGKADG